MHKRHCLFMSLLILAILFSGSVYADECVLQGTWVGTEGEAVINGEANHRNNKSEEVGYFSGLSIKFTFEKPKGSLFHGKKVSENHMEEFVGTLSRDKKTIYIADDDGYSIGDFIDSDTIELVYLRSGKDSKVAAILILKRENLKEN